MAVLTPEMQRELLKTALEIKMRADAVAALQPGRAQLNAAEEAVLLEDLNKVLLYRESWLTRMRELRKLKNKGLFTLEDEAELVAKIDAKLKAQPSCINNPTYGADAAADVAEPDATGFDGALKGMFSKITGGLDNGPFAFIGKLLQQIFSFIFPMISAFKEMGEKLNPKPTPADLLKEGLFEQADAELANQEAELIQKLKALEDGELTAILVSYEEELKELQKVTLENGTQLPFAQATKEHQRDTLRLRLDKFNDFSSKAAPALAAHAEAVSAQQQRALKMQQKNVLQGQYDNFGDKASLECEVLKARLDAIEAHAKDQKDKAELAAQRVISCVHNEDRTLKFKAVGDVHTPLWQVEQARQKALAGKERHAVHLAKMQAKTAHERQMALAQAQAAARPRPMAGPMVEAE